MPADVRPGLHAERTSLAWTRTLLTLFGAVAIETKVLGAMSIDAAVIMLGLLAPVVAVLHHWAVRRDRKLQDEGGSDAPWSGAGLLVSLQVLVLGLGVTGLALIAL